jgi:hypothetical protein
MNSLSTEQDAVRVGGSEAGETWLERATPLEEELDALMLRAGEAAGEGVVWRDSRCASSSAASAHRSA